MYEPLRPDRRSFLRRSAAAGAGVWAAGWLLPGSVRAADDPDKDRKDPQAKPDDADEEVSPPEDLMREHGVLKRILLVYDDAAAKIDAGQDVPVDALRQAAGIIRSFVEEYHEQLEEQHLFNRFRQAKVLVDLVDVLQAQHQLGRKCTERTLALCTVQSMKRPEDRAALTDSLRQFVRMYNPHEAREDTVLFPALRKIVSKNEFDALGEDFEKEEHRRFGADGFFGVVDQVAGIEKQFGLYDLSQFNPKV